MSKPKTGTVHLVGAGPGDPGLLTLRGAELLRRAQVVVHDSLVPPALLQLAPAGALLIDAGKRGPGPAPAQEDIHEHLIEQARAGRLVVRLKGGDPFVFGRSGEELQALAEAGVPFEVVPGVSAVTAVPACAGIPLTHRTHASAFVVVSGHADPATPDGASFWAQVARVHGTKVILMGAANLAGIMDGLANGGLPPSTPVAVVRQGTTSRQQTLQGTVADIARRAAEAGVQAPALAVVGEVVGLRSALNWFERRPLFGRRIALPRGGDPSGELARRLTNLGAEVLDVPTVDIAPPEQREPMIEALAGLGEYEWLLFAGPAAVTAFFDALFAAFEDVRALGNLRLAAASPAAAEQIRRWHLRVDATPGRLTGPAVAQALEAEGSLENLRVLLLRAEGSPHTELCRHLEELGAIVDDVGFYRKIPAAADPGGIAAAVAAGAADAVVFTTAESVQDMHARLDLRALAARHPALRLVALGGDTGDTLRRLAPGSIVETDPATDERWVEALGGGERTGPARRPARSARPS